MIKKVILFILFFIMISSSILVFAHENLLNVKYEMCDFLENTMDENDVMWYALEKDKNVYHIDNDVDTIKYYFSDNSKSDANYTWLTNFTEEKANFIKKSYSESMEKWNNVYYYSYDTNGNVTKHKIINVVEGTETDNNLIIYPYETQENDPVIAKTFCYLKNDYLITKSELSNISHYHIVDWGMEINRNYYYDRCMESNANVKLRTGMHEIGHVLGLHDLNNMCSCDAQTHTYSIMGYGNCTTNISYYDIAGVSITRGFHTDNDHIWMKRINDDASIDLICALCNGILYDVDISNDTECYNNKPLKAYKSCVHYGGINNNMLLVGTNVEQDFYKCLYCRHVETLTFEKEESLSNIKNISREIYIDKDEVKYLKINAIIGKNYFFHINSDEDIEGCLLDSNLNEIKNYTGKKNYFFKDYLDKGIYYLKIKYKQSNMYGDININVINESSGNGIIVDPSSADYCGTQISIVEKNTNSKSYRENFITKGFTRLIYLDSLYTPSPSRKDYYWYSSNEDILTVTEFGTVLGKSIGTAKIYGVYKADPSKVFVKEFNVINNADEINVRMDITQTYSISSSVPCSLNLTATNCPYPMLQYYNIIVITPNAKATVDSYGRVTVNGEETIQVRCQYKLNIKYDVYITLIITE